MATDLLAKIIALRRLFILPSKRLHDSGFKLDTAVRKKKRACSFQMVDSLDSSDCFTGCTDVKFSQGRGEREVRAEKLFIKTQDQILAAIFVCATDKVKQEPSGNPMLLLIYLVDLLLYQFITGTTQHYLSRRHAGEITFNASHV